MSHLSAAAHWVWELKTQPRQPDCALALPFDEALHGWLGLRFSWEDVILTPDDVDIALTEAVALRTASRTTGANAGSGGFRP